MFLQNNPFTAIAEDNRKEGRYVFRAKVVHPVPERWGFMAGDAIHNMRATLDNLFWAFARRHNDPPKNDRITFPIYRVKGSKRQGGNCWETQGENFIRCVSSEVGAVVKSVQPFTHAPKEDPRLHPLWVLDQLWNADKHRRLTPVGGATARQHFQIKRVVVMRGGFAGPYFEDGPFQDGDILAGVDYDPAAELDFDFEYKASFYVCLPEEGPARGAPLGDLLKFLHDELREKIIPRFNGL